VPKEEIEEVLHDSAFVRVEQEARKHFLQQNGQNLGEIVKIETQVVSGINYKITFRTSNGPVEVIVWSQPWTDTFQVMGVNTNLHNE
jgi:fructose-specific phosphotransferase system component IIB